MLKHPQHSEWRRPKPWPAFWKFGTWVQGSVFSNPGRSWDFFICCLLTLCWDEGYGQFVVAIVQPVSHVQLFATSWSVAHQAALSFTISKSLLKFMFIESVMLSNHFILCRPLLLPSTFPSIRIFPNELTLWIRWPYLLNGHISLPSLLSMEFSRQEYWSDLPFPPPMDHVLSEIITVTLNVCLEWPCTALLIASLSCRSPLAMTRLWYMKRGAQI